MKALITGTTGQLGFELIRQVVDYSFEAVPISEDELDITDFDRVKKTFQRVKPDLVINPAAYTNVDQAESEPEAAFRVNRDGAENLARICIDHDIPLIHVSTDYVFDGKKNEPYVEDDQVLPLGIYGKSKAAGEQVIESLLPMHIIIRTSWLYGVYGHNFVKTMIRLGKERQELSVVSDQFGCPTSATDLAEAILSVTEQLFKASEPAWGTYHYCGKGITSWHRFAETIFEVVGRIQPVKPPAVRPIPTSEYPTQVERPAYAALCCDRIRHSFGVKQKPWQQSLEEVIKRIFAEETL
ncbi:MAG TPA: dTDP-4-dehydrorhamnose reductase [Deltaproteobacteria bacterium]|nr:dTDP-4-dehydrorhamnose reductase [Deltaproteobacteria bacterium]